MYLGGALIMNSQCHDPRAFQYNDANLEVHMITLLRQQRRSLSLFRTLDNGVFPC